MLTKHTECHKAFLEIKIYLKTIFKTKEQNRQNFKRCSRKGDRKEINIFERKCIEGGKEAEGV